MNFGYPGKEDKDIIGHYNHEDNKLIINYLDGTQQEITYSKDTEKKLLTLMLEQAKERQNCITINTKEEERELSFKNACLSVIYTSLMAGLYITQVSKNTPANMIMLGLSCAIGVTIIINGKEYFIKIKEANEIKKYEYYLNEIEPNLTSVEESKQVINGKKVNINNIDKFSMQDLIIFNKQYVRKQI